MKKLFEFFTDRPGSQKGPTRARPKTDDSLLELGPKTIETKSTTKRLAAINKAPTDNLYDSLAFVIHCPKHNSLAVSSTEHTGGSTAVWLPFIYLSPTIGWDEAVNDGLALILSDNDNEMLDQLKRDHPWDECVIHLLRAQLPHTQRYITRLICLARLQSKKKNEFCCQKTSRISWINLNQIKNLENMWSNDILLYSKKVNIDMTDVDSYQSVEEHDLEWALKYVPRNPPRNEEEEMLRQLNISENVIERVLIDFLEHCFPAYSMTFCSFKNYFRKYGFICDDNRMNKFFNAFNFHSSGFLNFHELLLGMTCIDPDIYSGLARNKFIFRFYDSDKDGYLSESDFSALIKDLNPELTDDAIIEKVKEGMKAMKVNSNRISFKSFSTAVGYRRFRGTSSLCRSPRSLFTAISNAIVTKGLKANPELKKSLAEFMNKKIYDGVCTNCKKNKYSLASHSVTIGIDGNSIDYQLLKEYKDVEKNQPSIEQKKQFLSEKYSIEVTYNSRSLPNTIKREIQAFNAMKGTREEPKGIFSDSRDSRESLANMLGQLANDIIPIFQSEDRCVKVEAPAFVIGDIHGNLEDLLSIEKYLFKSFPIISANYVFLGDYVDRGKWSVECALYVICLKLLAPTEFYLLRGNHETKVLTEMYTFRSECFEKYDPFGKVVFQTFNKIFDCMPLAAVIDESIFCSHGGIPTTISTIKEINSISKNLKDVQNESKGGWEILWNDPVDKKEFSQTCELLKKREDISRGFVDNPRRGTAFFFNEFAVQEFLKINGLSHIIRAHEVPTKGYKFHFDQKCLTVFSCSHYCGKENRAAVAHIADHTIRILELDTRNNAPATD